MASSERAPGGCLMRESAARLGSFWVSKTVGLTLGMTAFFVGYFWLLRHPFFPVTVMPVIALDRWIGFRPWALPLYLSLWIYIPLGVVLVRTRRELVNYGLTACLLGVIGLGLFLMWPTAVPVLPVDWSAHPAFAFLKSVDASGNACPSLHVAFAVFTALCLGRVLAAMRASRSFRIANWVWCLGITYSTVAVGQHVTLDAVAGAGLGALVAGAARVAVRSGSANCSSVGTTQR